jgi:glycosyltransferase involved in cell wall biosynthesis
VPKISIIFTSYNHSEYLKKALDSILAQTFTDFELIIVDDCSTDGSQEILHYYESDTRVKLFLLEKNTGSYVLSSNFGANKAVSDYILFAQCDDFAEPAQLEKLYIAMINNPSVGVVFSSSIMVDKNGIIIGNDFEHREKLFKQKCVSDKLITSKEMKRFLLSSCVIPNLSAALIKRSLFEKQGGLSPDYLVLADWDFWLKTALETNFYYIREPLNNFRQHDTTIRASVKIKRQIEEVFRMYYTFFKLADI